MEAVMGFAKSANRNNEDIKPLKTHTKGMEML